MGQAKNRGTLSSRLAQAKDKINQMRPEFIICNECGNHIHDITAMDIRNLKGIDAAFAGICSECNGTSYAIKGTPEAMVSFTEALQSVTESEVILGSQTKEGNI